MEWYSWLIIIYLVIGVMKALNHLGTGRCGASGPLPTFIVVALLWPFI
jgi:hypothetical protein